ncbi:ISAon1 family transposase N-terminal region protein [Chryseobacterium gregarium]
MVVKRFCSGNTLKLHIRRRRCTDTKAGNIIQRDWNLIAQGTRMTQDFAEFLKKISRY